MTFSHIIVTEASGRSRDDHREVSTGVSVISTVAEEPGRGRGALSDSIHKGFSDARGEKSEPGRMMQVRVGSGFTVLHRGVQSALPKHRRHLRTDLEAIQTDRGSDRHVEILGHGASDSHFLDRGGGGIGDQTPPARMDRGHSTACRAGEEDRDAIRGSHPGHPDRLVSVFERFCDHDVGVRPGRRSHVDHIGSVDLLRRPQPGTRSHRGDEQIQIGLQHLRRGSQTTRSRGREIQRATSGASGGRERVSNPDRLQSSRSEEDHAVLTLIRAESIHEKGVPRLEGFPRSPRLSTMKNLEKIGWMALGTVVSTTMASPPTSLDPRPLINDEFELVEGRMSDRNEFVGDADGWSPLGETSRGISLWRPSSGDGGDAEWFDGLVLAMEADGGRNGIGQRMIGKPTPGEILRIGFGLGSRGDRQGRVVVSLIDAAGRSIAESAPTLTGDPGAAGWRRHFVDLAIPEDTVVGDPLTLRFQNVALSDPSGRGTALLDKISVAAVVSDGDGFRSLFNGRDLDGWIGNTKGYGVEGDSIRTYPDRAGGNLYTADEFDDFVFRFAFKVPPGANNGIAVRAPATGDAAYQGMEIQVLENSHPKYSGLAPWQFHGSIYGVAAARRGFQARPGEWNLEEIRMDGRNVRVVLNGAIIMDIDLDDSIRDGTLSGRPHPGVSREEGHIGFCGHGDVVHFKDLRLRDLSGTKVESSR